MAALTGAAEWRGAVGDVWAQEWRRTDRAFAGIGAALDAAVLAAAPPIPFAALDIGSGAGATSLALTASRPDARIVGVDLSADLTAVAAARAASRQGGPAVGEPAFVTGDAVAVAASRAPFDLIYSRHGVMFFAEPDAAFARLHAAAAPGASLVFSCFRERAANPWSGRAFEAVTGTPAPVDDDSPGPFAFADPLRVARILRTAGWRNAAARPVDAVFRIGAGDDPVADAVTFLARIGSAVAPLRALAADAQVAARGRLADLAAAYRVGDAIDFPAAAWIWTAQA